MFKSVGQFFSDIGVPGAVVTSVVLPLLAVALIVAMRLAALRLIARRVRRPKDLNRWRRITMFVAFVVAGVAFQGIWMSSVAQVSEWIAELTGFNEQAVRHWLETGLSVIFSTAALALAIVVARAAYRALLVRLRAWALKAHAIRFQRLELITPARLRLMVGAVLRIVYFGLIAAVVLLYTLFVLSVYPATARIGGSLLGFIGRVALGMAEQIVAYLPNVVYLLVIWATAYYAIKGTRFFLAAVGKRDITLPGFDPDWADPTYKLARVGIILFTMVVSYPYLPGSQSEVFKGFSVFVGAMLTLGSTAVIGNVISGVVLTYTGSFRVGDRVCMGQTTGDVLEKTLFVTRLRTVENEIVSIPNGVVLAGPVINYNRMAKRAGVILTVRVGIGYDVPWRQVHDLLENAAKATNNIATYPPPTVWELSLDDYAVTYQLRAATDQPARLGAIRASLHRSVLDAFNKAGVEIMTPSIHSVRDGAATAIPSEYNPPQPGATRLRIDLDRVRHERSRHAESGETY